MYALSPQMFFSRRTRRVPRLRVYLPAEAGAAVLAASSGGLGTSSDITSSVASPHARKNT